MAIRYHHKSPSGYCSLPRTRAEVVNPGDAALRQPFPSINCHPSDGTIPASVSRVASSYGDSALLSSPPNSAASISSPTSLQFSNSIYALPSDPLGPKAAANETVSLPCTSDDWMLWDEPMEPVIWPTIEPQSTPLELKPLSPPISEPDFVPQPIPATNLSRISDHFDDSVSTNSMNITDETLLSIAQEVNETLNDVLLSPRDILYLNTWSQELSRASYCTKANPTPNSDTSLTPAKQSKPCQMENLHLNDNGDNYSRSSLEPSSSPEPQTHKRKSSTTSSIESDCAGSSRRKKGGRHTRQPPEKTARNMIEKRYRTNLNDKIAELRDSVPSLRAAAEGDRQSEDEDLQGLSPAQKLNKATILTKAIEYIAHLEHRTQSLEKENGVFRSRVRAFEGSVSGDSSLNRSLVINPL